MYCYSYFPSTGRIHLYPCTSCPQRPAWGWLLLCTPWDVQQEGTVYLGIIMVSARPLPVTYRKSLPTTLIATAPTAVIVLQVQEHVSRKEHLSAREAPQYGSGMWKQGPHLPGHVRSQSWCGLWWLKVMAGMIERGWWGGSVLLNILMPFDLTAFSMDQDCKLWHPQSPFRWWARKRKEKNKTKKQVSWIVMIRISL